MTPPTLATATKNDLVSTSATPVTVTTGSLPGSAKIYAHGSLLLQGVNVAMRAISLFFPLTRR